MRLSFLPRLPRAVGRRAMSLPRSQPTSSITHRVRPFCRSAGMTRPERISGDDPRPSKEAVAAGARGLVLIKCVVRTSGEVTDCRFVKSIALLDQAVLDAIKTWRVKPIYFRGKPVDVDYTSMHAPRTRSDRSHNLPIANSAFIPVCRHGTRPSCAELTSPAPALQNERPGGSRS
ncbi:energy transducer TonB [Sorangium sp. So ce1128]